MKNLPIHGKNQVVTGLYGYGTCTPLAAAYEMEAMMAYSCNGKSLNIRELGPLILLALKKMSSLQAGIPVTPNHPQEDMRAFGLSRAGGYGHHAGYLTNETLNPDPWHKRQGGSLFVAVREIPCPESAIDEIFQVLKQVFLLFDIGLYHVNVD